MLRKDDMDDMTMGKRIMQLREQKQLTQGDLAQILGVTRSALSHYENGRRRPSYDKLRMLAGYFSVSIEYVLEDVER